MRISTTLTNPRTDFYSKVKFPIRYRSNIAYPTTNRAKMDVLFFDSFSPFFLSDNQFFDKKNDMAGYRNEFAIEWSHFYYVITNIFPASPEIDILLDLKVLPDLSINNEVFS